MSVRNVFSQTTTSSDRRLFFDEGPRPYNEIKSVSTLTSSIDTSAFDAYRQGVELTQLKHFDGGVVKIHAGTDGHILHKNRLGMDRNYRTEPIFQEIDYFDPVKWLQVQELSEPLYVSLLTFPIITSDNDQIENYGFDGVIEPLTIRPRAAFFSIDVPFEAHETKGAFMGSSTDQRLSSQQISNIYERNTSKHIVPYLDLVDMIDGQFPLNGYFSPDIATITPFIDERLVRHVSSSVTYGTDMIAAMSELTCSSDNMLTYKQLAANSGWVYDGQIDSISFGGLLF